jgi:hypothetical protein
MNIIKKNIYDFNLSILAPCDSKVSPAAIHIWRSRLPALHFPYCLPYSEDCIDYYFRKCHEAVQSIDYMIFEQRKLKEKLTLCSPMFSSIRYMFFNIIDNQESV